MDNYRTMPMKWATPEKMMENNPCACCGRTLKSKKVFYVHVIDGGASVLHPDDERLYESDSGDMDWHAIGPECAKKFKSFALKG